jgi:hypothetical protein
MSNLNNEYGLTNSCPAIMNDGRGMLTNFKNNKVITQDLRKRLKANTSNNYRNKLQKEELGYVHNQLETRVSDFVCDVDPEGEIKLKDNIVLENGDETSFLDHFRSLK